MCGRFVRYRKRKEYARALGVPVEDVPQDGDSWKPVYNVCPGTQVEVIHTGRAGPAFAQLGWGLLPYRTKNPQTARRPVNIRAETASAQTGWRRLLEWRRCLVPADAFYEWQAAPRGKIPYCFRRMDGEPFFFAGLWDAWRSPQATERIYSFALLTTQPNALTAKVHERMPVIVRPEDYGLWLDSAVADAARLAHVLAPYPEGELIGYPVSKAVGRPENDGPQLIEPAGELLEAGG